MLNMMKIVSFTVLFISLVFIAVTAEGQAYKPHPLLSPMWQAEAEYFPPSQVIDTTSQNGFTGASFSFRVPVFTGKDWLSADGGKPFYALLAHAGVNARQSQIDYIEPDRVLTVLRAGITGLMATGPSSLRNLYLLQFSVSSPSEDFALDPGLLRFHGAGIWRHLYHNNRFWHTLGLVYTPVTGRDMLFPVIGGGYKLGNEDQIQVTFPFNFAYTHLFSRKFSLSVRLNQAGSYYELKRDTIHPENPLIYRQRYPRLSLVARYITDRNVVLTPEAGVTGRSHLKLGETESTQLSSFYLKLTLQVRFGKRPAASPILNFDPGDSGFDPSYLVE